MVVWPAGVIPNMKVKSWFQVKCSSQLCVRGLNNDTRESVTASRAEIRLALCWLHP